VDEEKRAAWNEGLGPVLAEKQERKPNDGNSMNFPTAIVWLGFFATCVAIVWILSAH
jgi:hypothetical protein